MEEASKRIEEHESAEDALGQSEERFRRIFEYSNDAILVIDPARDQILDANSTACDMLRYSREELLSTPISAIHPNEMPQLRSFVDSVFEKGNGWTNELTCLTKTGDTLPSEISASVFEMGGRRCVLAMVRNIAERKRAEKALRESEERLASIVGSAMDGIVTVDKDRTIRVFNAAAEDIFGSSADDVIGECFDRFAPEALREQLARCVTAFDRNDSGKQYLWAPGGVTAVRADGEEFPIEATISQSQASGETLYTIILRDVNERVRAEEQLQRLHLENV
ncbi:MAG: PAS domain S-box protein, partial [Planctomycetes bacterium]|nr:PAS domain S-box protein [Planctomycetota bacterium]